ncbi:uncharacterized protein LOC134539425 isoform X3 [Bacillus rossius redtenbacheri]
MTHSIRIIALSCYVLISVDSQHAADLGNSIWHRLGSQKDYSNAAARSSEEEVCRTQSGALGVCYSEADCEELGGMDLSSCDENNGVCCIVEKSCRNTSAQTVSYFVNPSYPNVDTVGSFCDYRIDVINENICQIRLDFDRFSIMGPHSSMGICRNDRFMVMTTLPNGFGLSELCGENFGQHIYVPVDTAATDGVSVSLMVMTSGLKPYEWRIQVTQIDCVENPELVAPAGCLQYFTGEAGSIQSFNYDKGQGHYQSNLDYAMCIKRLPNTCQIVYRQVDGSKFWINSIDGEALEEGVGRAGTLACDTATHDYLYLVDGRGGGPDELDAYGDPVALTASSCDKFCGRSLSGLAVVETAEKLRTGYILEPPDNTSFPSPVTSHAAGPITLRFHSDEVTRPLRETGFHIRYQQMATGCVRAHR